MPILSITGPGTDTLYRSDDHLENLQEFFLSEAPEGSKFFSMSDTDYFVVTVPGQQGTISMYFGEEHRESTFLFEEIPAPAVCIKPEGEWWFLAREGLDMSLYFLRPGGSPVHVMSVDLCFSGMAYEKFFNKLVLLSSIKNIMMLVDPVTSVKDEVRGVIPSLKHGTGVVSDGKGHLYLYPSEGDNMSVYTILQDKDGYVAEGVYYTPIWREVGGEELTPSGLPAASPDGTVFMLSEESGEIVSHNPFSEDARFLSMSGLKAVSYDAFLYKHSEMVVPVTVDAGEVPVPFGSGGSFEACPGYHTEKAVMFKAPEGVYLSLDGENWHKKLVTDLDEYTGPVTVFYYVRRESSGVFSEDITVSSALTKGPSGIKLTGVAVIPEKIKVPVRAFSPVPGVLEGYIAVKKVFPTLIMKKAALKATFEE